MAEARRLRVWADTARSGRCRDESCQAALTFATVVASGKTMPFTGELVALLTERDPASGRQVWTVDFESSHFRSCPAARRFSSSRR